MVPGNGVSHAAGAGEAEGGSGLSHAAARAERLYAERRRRDTLFPPDLFGEPAWDLLLALFIARDKGKSVILCAAYRKAGVSDTTGRRVLDRLEREGLINRRRAPRSRKTRLVELTQEGVERLTEYLGS